METEWTGVLSTGPAQNKQNRRTYGTNTETTICTSGWLHAAGFFCPLSRCVVAGAGRTGQRQHLGGGDHSLKCPVSRTWPAGSTLIHRAASRVRQANLRALPAKHGTLRHGRTGKPHGNWEGRFLQVVLTRRDKAWVKSNKKAC